MPVFNKYELTCSFCGKPKGQVKALISGPSAHICNECTLLIVEILRDSGSISLDELVDEQAALPLRNYVNEMGGNFTLGDFLRSLTDRPECKRLTIERKLKGVRVDMGRVEESEKNKLLQYEKRLLEELAALDAPPSA